MGRFKNFVFVLSARTDSQYYSSSFFCSQIRPLKNTFLFLPGRFGPFGKSSIMYHPSPALWKNSPSCADPARRPGRVWASGQARARSDLYSKLIDTLNSFGQFISHSAMLEYDVSLTKMKLNSFKSLPVVTECDKFLTFVWDNIFVKNHR